MDSISIDKQLVEKRLPELIATDALLEDVRLSPNEVTEILAGPADDTYIYELVSSLAKGWHEITKPDVKLDLAFEQHINKIVGFDSAFPGELRNGSGMVITKYGDFRPPKVNAVKEIHYLTEITELFNNKDEASVIDKAVTLLYHNMRQQLFYDGNKRTAILVASKYLLDYGLGIIHVPASEIDNWMDQLARYYLTNDIDDIKKWTISHAIITE